MHTEEIALITRSLHESTAQGPIERGVAALLAYHGHNEPEPLEELVEDEPEGVITIFTRLRHPEGAMPLLTADVATFSLPILDINYTRNTLLAIERAAGAKDRQAAVIAGEMIRDFQVATSYPPLVRDTISTEELTGIVNGLLGKIDVARARAEQGGEAAF